MTLHPLGQTRTHVERDHAIIGTDSHVPSNMPGWQRTTGVMLMSPAMRGPDFAMYLAHLDDTSHSDDTTSDIQRLIYVLEGSIELTGSSESFDLGSEGYLYLPPQNRTVVRSSSTAKILVFEKRYVPLPSVDAPSMCHGYLHDVKGEPFLGNPDAVLACLLPDEPAFDMSVNVFTYQSGAALPFVETHVMEHGLYMTAGQGIYRLNESWYPVTEGDSIWMAPYCPQWFVAMGGKPAQYIYYKDVHRPVL